MRIARTAGAHQGRLARVVEVVAGLLGAGCLTLGAVLVFLQVVAPLTGGSDLTAATGPGWFRALAHLCVGASAELARGRARTTRPVIRWTVALGTLVAIFAVLALSWWR